MVFTVINCFLDYSFLDCICGDSMMLGNKQTIPEKEFVDYAMQLQSGSLDICADITKLVYTSPTPLHDLECITNHMKLMVDLMHRNANARINSIIVDIKLTRDRLTDVEENASKMFDLRKEMHSSSEQPQRLKITNVGIVGQRKEG